MFFVLRWCHHRSFSLFCVIRKGKWHCILSANNAYIHIWIGSSVQVRSEFAPYQRSILYTSTHYTGNHQKNKLWFFRRSETFVCIESYKTFRRKFSHIFGIDGISVYFLYFDKQKISVKRNILFFFLHSTEISFDTQKQFFLQFLLYKIFQT